MLTFVAWHWPRLGGLGTELRWLLPTVAFVFFWLFRLGKAPLEILTELDGRRDSAETELRNKRDRRLQTCLPKHHYSVHELLHKAPPWPTIQNDAAAFKLATPVWIEKVDAFNEERTLMKKRCTSPGVEPLLDHQRTQAWNDDSRGRVGENRPAARKAD
jgi:hypothetical protein